MELSVLKQAHPYLPRKKLTSCHTRQRKICEKFRGRCFNEANRMTYQIIKGASQDGGQASNGSLPTSITTSHGVVLLLHGWLHPPLLSSLPAHVLLECAKSSLNLPYLASLPPPPLLSPSTSSQFPHSTFLSVPLTFSKSPSLILPPPCSPFHIPTIAQYFLNSEVRMHGLL